MPRKRKKKDDVPRELTLAGNLSLAFVNTALPRIDRRRKNPSVRPADFRGFLDLVAWLQELGALTLAEIDALLQAAEQHPGDADVAFRGALELRATLHRLFNGLVLGKTPRREDVDTLNAAISRGGSAQHLTLGGDDLSWGWSGGSDPFASLFGPLALAAGNLLASEQRARIRQCGMKGCLRLFFAKNLQRVWCDPNTCGSRFKGARHYKVEPARRGRHLYR